MIVPVPQAVTWSWEESCEPTGEMPDLQRSQGLLGRY